MSDILESTISSTVDHPGRGNVDTKGQLPCA